MGSLEAEIGLEGPGNSQRLGGKKPQRAHEERKISCCVVSVRLTMGMDGILAASTFTEVLM